MFQSKSQILQKQRTEREIARKAELEAALEAFNINVFSKPIVAELEKWIEESKISMRNSIGNADLMNNYSSEMLAIERVVKLLTKYSKKDLTND